MKLSRRTKKRPDHSANAVADQKTWEAKAIERLVSYGSDEENARAIVESETKAFKKFAFRFIHFDELPPWESEADTHGKKRRALWEYKASRHEPSDWAKAEVKKAVDEKDTAFLIDLGKVLKQKPRAFDKFRAVLILCWTRGMTGLPPLCLWTDQALTDLANILWGRGHTLEQVRKIRQRELKLIRGKTFLIRKCWLQGNQIGISS